MRFAILTGAMLLAACGSANTNGPAKSSNAGTTAQPSRAAADAAIAACAQKPDFVPVYAGAVVATCVAGDAGGGKTGGNLVYTVATGPASVLDWSADRAAKAGLTEKLRTPTMLSASESDKRTLVVIVSPEGSGTRAMVNWAVEP